MDEWNKWNTAAGGWTEDILRILLEYGLGPDFEDLLKEKRETTRKVTNDERFIRTTTLSLIQEGEFEEIEDAETGEIAVRELEDQAADRREEILSDEADEGRVQGGGEETVCGLRDREEEPNNCR